MKDTVYDDFIGRLRVESDIVGVISDYVPLKKKGRNYWGCCPFHHEKTPSFSVSPEKGFYYCFGCQSGGNVFNFLMKVENIGFFEAVKLLAQKMNIPVPEKEKSDEEIALEKERARLFSVNEMARDFYHACLTKTNYGKLAREYLANRGVDAQIIKDFKLGFAPQSWDRLLLALRERGIETETLVKAGLAINRTSGDGSYDRFRNRIMYPIHDIRGHVVGFGGRVLDGSQPKYLNSPETTIFNKRHILYGLHVADKYIRQSGQAIIVEGYMDAITAHAAGIKNVVASLGTAFTTEQARLLRNVSEIIFAYDSDAAGKNATMRALDTVRKLGAAVRIVDIPDGKDPDEFIRKHGPEAFRKLVIDSLALLDYQINQAFIGTDHSTLSGKIAVVAKVVPALAAAENAIEVNEHITHIAQELSIDESAIRTEVSKFLSFKQKDKNVNMGKNIATVTLAAKPVSAINRAEQTLIRLMCDNSDLIPYIQAQLFVEGIQDKEHRKIINSIFNAYNMEKNIIDGNWVNILSDETNSVLSHIMLIDIQYDDITKLVDDCVKTLRLAHLKTIYEQHRLRADELERMGDSSFLQELAESQRIKDEISKLYYS